MALFSLILWCKCYYKFLYTVMFLSRKLIAISTCEIKVSLAEMNPALDIPWKCVIDEGLCSQQRVHGDLYSWMLPLTRTHTHTRTHVRQFPKYYFLVESRVPNPTSSRGCIGAYTHVMGLRSEEGVDVSLGFAVRPRISGLTGDDLNPIICYA